MFCDHPYGDASDPLASTRYVRLHAPPEDVEKPHGTVIVLHGGYWKNAYGLGDEYNNAGVGTVAPFFVRCGYSAVEIEYRRRDHDGGGWPGTNDDVIAAVRHLVKIRDRAENSAARALPT